MAKAKLNSTRAIKDMILASAPERQDELRELWIEYSPSFQLKRDEPGFNMEGGPYGLILFTGRSMRLLWILGFASYYAFLQYTGLLLHAARFGLLDPVILQNIPIAWYDEVIDSIQKLTEAKTEEDFQWPARIPPATGKPKDQIGSIVFDLLCMAGAYCFLHEVQHVRIFTSGEVIDPHQEEKECDQFARSVLLDNIEVYAKQSGYKLDALKTKRAMSIAMASFFLLVLTPTSVWQGSRSHPSIYDRIIALTNSLSLPDNDVFWTYLSSLLLVHLRFSGFGIGPTRGCSQRQLCLELLEVVRC